MGITKSKFRGLLADDCAAVHRKNVLDILLEFIPESVLECCSSQGIKVRPLRSGETYTEVSPYIRNLDLSASDREYIHRSAAGMFVRPERTAYLARHNPETVVHEFGHAFDCALGRGSYLSTSFAFQLIYHEACCAGRFITDYAGSQFDEFFAESFRAFLGVNHDQAGIGHPRFATPEMLRRLHPAMFSMMERLVKDGTTRKEPRL